MAREGEAELFASFRSEGASVKEESASREAFAISESADAGELSSHGRSMRGRRDGSSEAARGEEMQDRREGEAGSLRELRIGRARSKEGI
jgi:hypothetical protein